MLFNQIHKRVLYNIIFLLFNFFLNAQQEIGDFVSVEPLAQNTNFIIPSSHVFQKIIEESDPLTFGGVLPSNSDFAGYVPISGSSSLGYLSINSEAIPGGVSILDINFNSVNKLWGITSSKSIDFTGVGGTAKNCSGTVTSWGTIISCEEIISTEDLNNDGHNDLGWCVEIDPITKEVIDKRWALGNFMHENITIHENQKTVYEGADSNPGYLYKFVADNIQDLSIGKLYVYSGSKNGPGNWILINNSTPTEQNETLTQSANVNGTIFNGIEDVEIGPDGWVYFAVKGESRVYRFNDSDPITGTNVIQMETYVGNASYIITHENGETNTNWGGGNDNLAFDGDGNLWVLQDGGNKYIWVVKNGHTQAAPKVEIFGRTPLDSEPTGITFTPDYKFMFLSLQHPNTTNDITTQIDVAGNIIGFKKDITLVVSLEENLGTQLSLNKSIRSSKVIVYPIPARNEIEISLELIHQPSDLSIIDINGRVIYKKDDFVFESFNIDISSFKSGLYFLIIKNKKLNHVSKIIKK